MASQRICEIQGCGKRHIARGWCAGHYQRWLSHGDPLAGGISRTSGEATTYYHMALAYDGEDCLIWPFARYSNGRAKYKIKDDGRTTILSRRICEDIHGDPPTKKHHAAHSCGNGHGGCINPRHLRWRTAKENHAEKVVHGTDNRGENHPLARLMGSQVKEIRALKGKSTASAIGESFGISERYVHKIWSGRKREHG